MGLGVRVTGTQAGSNVTCRHVTLTGPARRFNGDFKLGSKSLSLTVVACHSTVPTAGPLGGLVPVGLGPLLGLNQTQPEAQNHL